MKQFNLLSPLSRLYSSESNETKQSKNSGASLYFKYAWGGSLGTLITHSAAVPIDVVKTRLQLHPERYSGMFDGFRQVIRDEGLKGLTTGLGPTALGYFMQGAFKFGFYEFFKQMFINITDPDTAVKFRTPIYLASAAMAETIADLALCPMEATRIRLVSEKGFATGLASGFAKIWRNEGFLGFYKGLGPILLKQVPYTMAKFSVYEKAIEFIYGAMKKEPTDVSTRLQLSISLLGGIIAGTASAIVSHPADTVLSVINKNRTEGPVLKAIVQILKELGFRKLWLGLGARIIMISALTAGQFFVYDVVKKMFDIPPSKGIEKKKIEKKQ